ncbi:AraC family transcriptional regulator [Nocardioides sp. WV_118_6]
MSRTSPTGLARSRLTPLHVTGIDAWSSLCSTAYVPLATVADPGFRGSMHETTAGVASISQVGSTAATIQRGRPQVRADPREALILSIFLTGGGTVLQSPQPAAVRAGAGYLLESDRPYSVRFAGRYDMLALRLPAARTGLDRRELGALTGRPIGAAVPELAVLRGHLAQLVDEPPAPAEEATEQAVLGELLGALGHRMLHPDRPQPRLSGAALVTHARWYLQRHHTDPDFGIDDAARAYGVSRRHLEAAFARRGQGRGPGPGAHLRTVRMRRASQLLAADRDLTVAAAARRAGFGDVNTFIRAFRRQWHTTPDSWRRGRSAVAPLRRDDDRLLTDLGRLTWARAS